MVMVCDPGGFSLQPESGIMQQLQRAVRTWLCVGLTLVMGVIPGVLSAQETKKPLPKDPPFLVVCASSMERLLGNIDYMFASAGRPELSEMTTGALANIGDLKGLKRDSSMGIMLFLNNLAVTPIGFVPVDNIDDLLKTVQIGPITTKKIEEDRYELSGPNVSTHVKIKGGYAFVSNDVKNLERDFANPADITRKLSSAYDIAVQLNFKAIPKSSRDFFLDFVKASNEAAIQQRDDEPDAAFRIRKAASVANVEGLELVLTQAEEFLLGFKVDPEAKQAFLEFSVTANPDTDYAQLLKEVKNAKSRYHALHKLAAPASMAGSLKMDKPGVNFLTELLTVGEGEAVKDFSKARPAGDGQTQPVAEIFQSLLATVKEGRLDFVFQFVGDPPGPYTLIGVVKVNEAERFQTGLTEIFNRLKDNKDLDSVETNVVEHRKIVFHRLQGKNLQEGAVRFFGAEHGLYAGAGEGTLWIALGGEQALPTLRETIDHVLNSNSQEDITAFRLEVYSSLWRGLIPANERGEAASKLIDEAFSKGGDAVRVELSPIEDGAKVRLTVEEGYIKMLGKAIGVAVDSRQQ